MPLSFLNAMGGAPTFSLLAFLQSTGHPVGTYEQPLSDTALVAPAAFHSHAVARSPSYVAPTPLQTPAAPQAEGPTPRSPSEEKAAEEEPSVPRVPDVKEETSRPVETAPPSAPESSSSGVTQSTEPTEGSQSVEAAEGDDAPVHLEEEESPSPSLPPQEAPVGYEGLRKLPRGLIAAIKQAPSSTPCQVHAFARHGHTWFVACGEAGLWTFEEQPPQPGVSSSFFVFRNIIMHDGSVTGLVMQSGQIRAEITKTSIVPLDKPAQPVAPSQQPEPIGEVVETSPLRVTVKVSWSDVQVGDPVGIRAGNRAIVGRVVDRNGNLVKVRIGLGEPIPAVGSPAFLTMADPTRKLAIPKTAPHQAGLSVLVRIGNGRSFDFSDEEEFGSTTNRPALATEFDAYVNVGKARVGAQLQPLALFRSNLTSYDAFLYGSYESNYFGAGFAVGASRVLLDYPNPPGTGTSFGPLLRIGSHDGLHLKARGTLVIHRQAVVPGLVWLRGQLPVHERIFLLTGFGAGSNGYFFGEGGGRFMIRGDGRAGTIFLSVLAGGSSLLNNDVTSSGPHVAAGVEVRL